MMQFEHVCFKNNSSVLQQVCVPMCAGAHVHTYCSSPALHGVTAELSWQDEMYYQLPTWLGIVPVQQSGKV